MLIDWFTVAAQALNFLILVWLLKRYLYKPILNAIDAREKLIAGELADAAAKKADAQKEHDEFQKKNADFDGQRAALLAKATDEAKTERGRLLDEARQAADALSARRQESLVNDAHNLNQAICRRAQAEVFAITRKALTDLATVSLEQRMGEVFTRRLRALADPAKALLGDALKKNSEPALVRSTFDLPAEQRAAIQNALNETFHADLHLQFETTPDLISGIEVSAHGQKVGWSIADYLATLETDVAELLKPKDKPKPKAPPKPAEPKPEPAKPEAKSVPVPETKAEAKPEGKPAGEAKLPAAPKPDTGAPAPAAAKVDPKPAAKDEPKANAAPKPEEPKPEPAKAATAPEAKAEAKPEGKPAGETKPLATPKPETGSPAPAEAKVDPKAATKDEPC